MAEVCYARHLPPAAYFWEGHLEGGGGGGKKREEREGGGGEKEREGRENR